MSLDWTDDRCVEVYQRYPYPLYLDERTYERLKDRAIEVGEEKTFWQLVTKLRVTVLPG